MLDVGTSVSFTDPTDGSQKAGRVESCNRRGTRCSIELRPGELRTVDLSKVEYSIAEGDKQKGETASGSEEGSGSEGEPGDEAEEEDAEGEQAADEEGALGSDEDSEEELPSLDAFDEGTRGPVDGLCAAASGPEAFAQPSQQLSDAAKQGLKALFAFMTASAPEWAPKASLPELYVEGFDAEQIWGQVEAAAAPLLKQLRKRMKPLNEGISLLDAETEAAIDELMQDGDDSSGSSEREEDGMESGGEDESDGLEEAEEDVDRQRRKKSGARASKKKTKAADEAQAGERLPTEDDFLRLADMERFVQDAEEAAMRGAASEEDQEGEDEDEEDDDDDLGGGIMEGLNEAALGGDDADALGEESNSDEEDAQLARLLESASDMAGRKSGKKGGKRPREEDSEEDEDYYYEDFFGARGRPGPGRQGEEGDQEEDGGTLLGEEGLSDFEADEDEDMEGEEGEEEYGEEGFEGEEEDDADDDDPEGNRAQLLGTLQRMLDDKRAEEEGGVGGPQERLSAHEQRVARMAQRARRLEEENMGEKDWFMRGETKAGARPLNSALEVDMDFDRALKPPPQPTEEFTSSLEDLIKRRIVDRQFDDPTRREPPPDELNKELAELDDKRSTKGLGDVYEEEYVRAKTGNAVEDKDEDTRRQAKVLLKGLFAKLDALSHFHFAPKPIIKEMAVQSEVPALAMEEVAPQVVSEAARQLPEEVYKAPKTKGAAKAGELASKAERKRSRAAHKRGIKKRLEQEAEEGKEKTGKTNIVGRKSAEEDAAAVAAEKKSRKKAKRKRGKEEDSPAAPKIKYTKSAAVFGKIQDAINSKGAAKVAGPTSKSSKNLKL